jgi:hypothetical protein
MHYQPASRHAVSRILYTACSLLCFSMFFVATPTWGQQPYVGRFDTFTGFTFLDSPHVSLFEPGVHLQVGMRRRTWYSVGFDYSYTKGDLTLTPDLLPDALRQQLAAQLSQLAALGVIPANYTLTVPTDSTTHSFAAGPQLAYRRWKLITLMLRPSVGAIHETATPRPTDAIATSIVAGLTPTGKKTDWTGFYGVGGGADLNFSKHVSLRVQADLVWDHLFNDILKDGRYTVRFSVGPAFQWGRNIVK